jgi:hypothetical protein
MPDPVEPAEPTPPADRTRDTPDPINPTVAGWLTPLARARVYAVLAVLVPLTATVVAVLDDGWQWSDLNLILASLGPAAGFGLARSNTPVTRR